MKEKSQQLEKMQHELEDARNQVADLNASVKRHENDMKQADAKIAELSANIHSLKSVRSYDASFFFFFILTYTMNQHNM